MYVPLIYAIFHPDCQRTSYPELATLPEAVWQNCVEMLRHNTGYNPATRAVTIRWQNTMVTLHIHQVFDVTGYVAANLQEAIIAMLEPVYQQQLEQWHYRAVFGISRTF